MRELNSTNPRGRADKLFGKAITEKAKIQTNTEYSRGGGCFKIFSEATEEKHKPTFSLLHSKYCIFSQVTFFGALS